MNFPTSSFFINRNTIHDISSPTVSDIKDTRIWQSNDKTEFYGKTIPSFSLKTQEPLEIAEALISYDKCHSPILLKPTAVVLPSQNQRCHFIFLTKTENRKLPLDYFIANIKSQQMQQQWDDTSKMIIALGVAIGMKELHANKLAHNNLSSSSILLDEKSHPFIWDFYFPSIMKYENYAAFAQSRYLFCAPETMNQIDCGMAADVYSYGMILRLLQNSLPPYNPNLGELGIYKSIQQGIAPTLNIGTVSFLQLASKCLSLDPSLRPSFDTIVKTILDAKTLLFPRL